MDRKQTLGHRRATTSISRLPRSSATPDTRTSPVKNASITHKVLPDGSSDASNGLGIATDAETRAVRTIRAGKSATSTVAKRKSLQDLAASPQKRLLSAPAPARKPTLAELQLPEPPSDPDATIKPPRRILSASQGASRQAVKPSEKAALERAQLPTVASASRAKPKEDGVKSPIQRRTTPSSPVVRVSTPPARRLSSRASSYGAGATPSPQSGPSAKGKARVSTYDYAGVSSPATALMRARRTELGSPAQLSEVQKNLTAAHDMMAQLREEMDKLHKEANEAAVKLEERKKQEIERREADKKDIAASWRALRQDYLREATVMRWIGDDLEHWKGVLEAHVLDQ